MTDFFETRVENLEPKEEKKISSAAAERSNKKSLKKRKQEDSCSSVVESSEESTVKLRPKMKFCIILREKQQRTQCSN